MDAEIAFLESNNHSPLLDKLALGLSGKGYGIRTYSIDELAVLEEALRQEHWLAIASGSLDKERLKHYLTQAKGGVIETPNPRSYKTSEDIRSSIEDGAVDFAYWMDVPNFTKTIENAARSMHLPYGFFRNSGTYCRNCLDVVAPMWRGSNEFGHPLKFYAWQTASKSSPLHLVQLERAACIDFDKYGARR